MNDARKDFVAAARKALKDRPPAAQTRAEELNLVALDTVATIADELSDIGFAIAMLPMGATHFTLAELHERRASISGRLGETRRAAERLVALLREGR